MKKLTLITAIILTANLLFAQIINIPDDYPTIQEGIDAACNGDTVLVAPDTYFEKINFNGKNITLASHYIINPDTSLISQTIIDGNHSGSVVKINAGTLNGFTITNGFACFGGGIDCSYSDINISLLNLIICNNAVDIGWTNEGGKGGGIYIDYYAASPTIENVVIKNNNALCGIFGEGGGIYCENSTSSFKDITIENNTAGYGGGMCLYGSDPIMKNVTIRNNVAFYYAGGIYIGYGSQPIFDSSERCNIYNNTSMFGNELVSGSPIEIFLDTFTVLQPTSYHVLPVECFSFDILNGIYEQVFDDVYVSPDGDDNNSGLTPDDPLQTISHTQAILYSDSTNPRTIYLAEGIYSPSTNNEIFPVQIPDYTNLTGTSASEVILDAEGSERVIAVYNGIANMFSNITITGADPEYYMGAILCVSSNPTLIQLNINNNQTCGVYLSHSNPIIQNTTISGNSANKGGGIYMNESNPTILNTTISGNSAFYGGGIYKKGPASITRVINSILWENSPQEIFLSNGSSNISTINFSYSDIQGGEAGIVTNGNVTINWQEGNIDEDPLFEGTGDHPYMLSNESPCINTGTPDTTGLNLPELDLAGNPRLYGGRIDMGAYENQEVVVTTKEPIHQLLSTDIQIFPNPARNEIFISGKDGVIIKEINIYNQIGQRVIHKKGKTNTVDVSMLRQGMYIIEIEIDNGKYRSKLMIEK